jgi:hypothetical protein
MLSSRIIPLVLVVATTAAPLQAQARQPATTRPSGAWALVPAPTSCYPEDDRPTFLAAKTAIDEARLRQREINDRVAQQMQSGAGAMAATAQMQAAMMKDPQRMMKIMQEIQEASAAVTEAGSVKEEKMKEFKAELERLENEYKAGLKPLEPVWQRYQGVIPGGEGRAGTPEQIKAAAMAVNQVYEGICAQWFLAPQGRFVGSLSRVRAYLTAYAQIVRRADNAMMAQWKMMGVDPAGYESLADHEAAIEYVELAEKAYGNRQTRAREVW